jgi:hypothetical protein
MKLRVFLQQLHGRKVRRNGPWQQLQRTDISSFPSMWQWVPRRDLLATLYGAEPALSAKGSHRSAARGPLRVGVARRAREVAQRTCFRTPLLLTAPGRQCGRGHAGSKCWLAAPLRPRQCAYAVLRPWLRALHRERGFEGDWARCSTSFQDGVDEAGRRVLSTRWGCESELFPSGVAPGRRCARGRARSWAGKVLALRSGTAVGARVAGSMLVVVRGTA